MNNGNVEKTTCGNGLVGVACVGRAGTLRPTLSPRTLTMTSTDTDTMTEIAAAIETSTVKWEAPESLGSNFVAAYIAGLTFGVHAGEAEDRWGNVAVTYTVVNAADGSEVSHDATFDNAEDAVALTEKLHLALAD